MTGSAGQLRVPTQWLADLQIPLPSLDVQRCIVAKIEELFSDLDAGVAALERAKTKLKRYRAAVLKAAVEGRLTEAWRREHPDTEPAERLLERILIERRQRWEAEQRRKYTATGKTPPKDWQNKYQEPQPPDTTSLPELPKGWCWTTLDQLAEYIRNGWSKKPNKTPPGFGILRISAVRPMRVDLGLVRYVESSMDEVAAYLIEEGDLLFTRYNGSLDLLGVCGRVPAVPEPTMHPDKLIRVRTVLPYPMNAFVEIASNTGLSRVHLARRARTTAGQTGISGQDVRETPIPLAPVKEQAVIVEAVDYQLSVIDAMDMEIYKGLQRAARLRQSILKHAFEGRLV